MSDAPATGVRCTFPGPPPHQGFWDFALLPKSSGDSEAGGTCEVQVQAPKLGLVTCVSITHVLRDGGKAQTRTSQAGADETFAFSAYTADLEEAAAGLGGKTDPGQGQCHHPSSQPPSAWAFPPGTFSLPKKVIIGPVTATAAVLQPRGKKRKRRRRRKKKKKKKRKKKKKPRAPWRTQRSEAGTGSR